MGVEGVLVMGGDLNLTLDPVMDTSTDNLHISNVRLNRGRCLACSSPSAYRLHVLFGDPQHVQ